MILTNFPNKYKLERFTRVDKSFISRLWGLRSSSIDFNFKDWSRVSCTRLCSNMFCCNRFNLNASDSFLRLFNLSRPFLLRLFSSTNAFCSICRIFRKFLCGWCMILLWWMSFRYRFLTFGNLHIDAGRIRIKVCFISKVSRFTNLPIDNGMVSR